MTRSVVLPENVWHSRPLLSERMNKWINKYVSKCNHCYGITLLGKAMTALDVQYFLKTIKSHMVKCVLHICHTEAVILAFYVFCIRSLLPLFEFHIYFFIILNVVYNPPGTSIKSHFGFLIVQGPHFWLAGEKKSWSCISFVSWSTFLI